MNKLHKSGTKPHFDRWPERHAEHSIATHADRRLTEQPPVDVDAYLAELGRKPVIKAWQFRQAVDAMQKLFELASTEPSPSRRLLPKPVPAPRMHPIDPC